MRVLFPWGLCALAFASHARAADVTEATFLAGLDEAHAAVRALGGDLARAEGARRTAGTLPNPRLEFWREQPDANSHVSNWTLAWTPPLDGRFGLGKRAAGEAVAAARQALVADRAGLRREMRRGFAAWSLSHARCELLAERLEQVAALAEQERHRARVGEESGLAARRLALVEAEFRARLREAEAMRARAVAEARAWQPSLERDARPLLPALAAPPPSVDAAASPRVRSVEHRLEQAQIEARLAGRFWSFPTLQLGVQRLVDSGGARSGPIFAASWSIPLFDRNQGARVEAELRAQVAASQLDHARALSEAAVRGGLDAYRLLFTAAAEAEPASAEIGRVIEAATAAYRAGESSLTDLLDALRAASETGLRELDLREQALAAHRDLEAALGRPLTELIEGGVR